ncbi:MAG TPA: immunoglobulin domain-containing protein [Verrucomicrobiae bacterium]|nr:immunoglobulin domain-containing protein [Verrucomicrobiae bacterium]
MAQKLIACIMVIGAIILQQQRLSAADTNILTWSWSGGSGFEAKVPQMPTNVIALAGSDYHCVALLADRTVRAWGAINGGETNVPPSVTNIFGIAAGNYNGLAVNGDGEVRIWGNSAGGGAATVPPEATNVVALGVGRGALHSLALRADGTVADWGWFNGLTPTIPESAFNIVSVAAGSYHSLALRSDGQVISWGVHANPVPASATNIVAIAAGDDTSVAVRADGTVLTWGSSIAAPPASVTNVVDIACFQSGGGIALTRDGKAIGWGNFPPSGQVFPAKIAATNIMVIGADSWGALAVKADGPPIFPFPAIRRTVASGQTAYLQLRAVGALPLTYQWRFHGTNLPGATNCTLAIANAMPENAGFYSLIASNTLGVITNSELELAVAPVLIANQSTNFTTFVGDTQTLKVFALGQSLTYQWALNGTNISWGTNSSLTLTNLQLSDAGEYSVTVSNEFGLETRTIAIISITPILITQSPQNVTTFPGGTATLSIAVQAGSPLTYQWLFDGEDLSGSESILTLTNVQFDQAGTYEVIAEIAGASVTNSAVLTVSPVATWGTIFLSKNEIPAGLSNVIALAAGDSHSLALESDGTVKAWGDGEQKTNVPANVTNVVAISAGYWGSLALRADGEITGWGDNGQGQTNIPLELTNVLAVAAGGYHSLALKADGTIVAWGQNDSGQTNVPAGLNHVISIGAGAYHSLALKDDGTVIAWGKNSDGQTNVPVDLTNVVEIAAGTRHSVALVADGTLTLWGAIDNYGLKNIPSGATNIVAVRAGNDYCVALRADGTVFAWGYPFFNATNIPAGLQHVTAIAAGRLHNLALIGGQSDQPKALVVSPEWNNSGFHVSTLTQSGKVYRLEHKDDLSDSNWISHPLSAGTGGTITLNDETADGSQRFYRIRCW